MSSKRNIQSETSNNAYTRGLTHQQGFATNKQESPMVRHNKEHHNGRKTQFKMNVTATYRNDSLKRQIAESLNIEHTDTDQLINNRTEWMKCSLPRLKTADNI